MTDTNGPESPSVKEEEQENQIPKVVIKQSSTPSEAELHGVDDQKNPDGLLFHKFSSKSLQL